MSTNAASPNVEVKACLTGWLDTYTKVNGKPSTAGVAGMNEHRDTRRVHDRLARVGDQGIWEVSGALPTLEPLLGRAGFQRPFRRVRPRCEAGEYRFFELRIICHFINRNSVMGVAGIMELRN